jgi:hypothetical protein
MPPKAAQLFTRCRIRYHAPRFVRQVVIVRPREIERLFFQRDLSSASTYERHANYCVTLITGLLLVWPPCLITTG